MSGPPWTKGGAVVAGGPLQRQHTRRACEPQGPGSERGGRSATLAPVAEWRSHFRPRCVTLGGLWFPRLGEPGYGKVHLGDGFRWRDSGNSAWSISDSGEG